MDKTKLTRGGAGPVGLPTGEVNLMIDGTVETVQVRAMNRGEVLHTNKLNESAGQLAVERYVLSSCMVDPVLTEEDVDAWHASAAAMECQPVLHKINELSGIGKGAEKSGVSGVREEPNGGV